MYIGTGRDGTGKKKEQGTPMLAARGVCNTRATNNPPWQVGPRYGAWLFGHVSGLYDVRTAR